MFVLDSSATLAMLLPDEQNEKADALADRLQEGRAAVPTIWPLEVRNALLAALRRRRLTNAEFEDRLKIAAGLPVEVGPPADAESLSRMASIAKRHDLSLYDASYLALAKQRGLPLATLNAALRRACSAQRIAVLS